ncbi:transposase [Streptomyces sp. NPDC055966]|uniref:transposase n=1 Tax=Streptomyces sp. NPDC055966 TaxID=3345669 RepID=UPI0035DB6966
MQTKTSLPPRRAARHTRNRRSNNGWNGCVTTSESTGTPRSRAVWCFLWHAAWSEFTPYLAFPPEIRKVVYSTNLIESINARLRKATRNRGHFPSEQAALKVLYLAVREQITPRARDVNHVAAHWKKALNQFSLFFEDRLNTK